MHGDCTKIFHFLPLLDLNITWASKVLSCKACLVINLGQEVGPAVNRLVDTGSCANSNNEACYEKMCVRVFVASDGFHQPLQSNQSLCLPHDTSMDLNLL